MKKTTYYCDICNSEVVKGDAKGPVRIVGFTVNQGYYVCSPVTTGAHHYHENCLFELTGFVNTTMREGGKLRTAKQEKELRVLSNYINDPGLRIGVLANAGENVIAIMEKYRDTTE